MVLKGFGKGRIRKGETTERAFDRFVDEKEIIRVLDALSSALAKQEGRVCYIFGMGSHPKSSYMEFAKEEGLEVKFFRSILPKKWRFLQIIVASFEGVIKVHDPKKIKSTFLKLMHLAMVGLYIFDERLENEFLSEMSAESPRKNFDFGITKDNGFLVYEVDGDSSESPTGLIEIVHYGPSAIWKDF